MILSRTSQTSILGYLVVLLAVGGLLGSGTGCAKTEGAGDTAPDEALLRVNLDKSDAERLLRYYFGGYADEAGANPFDAGLLLQQAGRFYIHLDTLDRSHPGLGARLQTAAGADALEWEELLGFVQDTYYDVRRLPPTLADLQGQAPYGADSTAWFTVAVDGVMTSARRHLYVEREALRYALAHYHENDEQLLYPVGTTIVGEHYLDGAHRETTVMRKRADSFWDFFTYGPDGRLAAQTQTPPKSLRSPTQCVGCHFGSRLFEPEESFPAEAQDGPHGPRALYVDEAWRDMDVVRYFREHMKRSDTVLGLYNTLFVASLRAQRQRGTLPAADAKLLQELNL